MRKPCGTGWGNRVESDCRDCEDSGIPGGIPATGAGARLQTAARQCDATDGAIDIGAQCSKLPIMRTLALLLLVSTGGAFADDWPQWLGEQRDGIWREAGVRKSLPEAGAKIMWRAPVGWGYAGPAVAEGKVYLPDFVVTDGEFDARSQGGRPLKGLERILCLDAETGKPEWKFEHEVTYTVSYPGGPRVTPTVAGGRLYFQGTMGHLLCLDAKNGALIWKRDICKDYQCTPPRWGYASHPLVFGDLV